MCVFVHKCVYVSVRVYVSVFVCVCVSVRVCLMYISLSVSVLTFIPRPRREVERIFRVFGIREG